MIDIDPDEGRVPESARDGVAGVDADEPLVVSISDIHGYLGAARSALRTLGDHDDYDPLVAADDDGTLHWAGGTEYVLVFNGDLIDRGPDNDGVVALVERLAAEAPPGHVRVTLGNHEWGVLCPDIVRWDEWYSGQRSDDDRRRLCAAVDRGHVVAAFDGYGFTYAHAGLPREYDPARLNDRLAAAAAELAEVVGTSDDEPTQYHLVEEYDDVLGLGKGGGRGFGAGIAWLDFRYLPGTAPATNSRFRRTTSSARTSSAPTGVSPAARPSSSNPPTGSSRSNVSTTGAFASTSSRFPTATERPGRRGAVRCRESASAYSFSAPDDAVSIPDIARRIPSV